MKYVDKSGLDYMCDQAGLSAWCETKPGIYEILDYYHDEMKENNIKGSDSVFHCIASCKAKKNNGAVDSIRFTLNRKEDSDYLRNLVGMYGNRKKLSHDDMIKDMNHDKIINEKGLDCPDNVSCEQQCESYVNALPTKSRKKIKQYFNMGKYNRYPG